MLHRRKPVAGRTATGLNVVQNPNKPTFKPDRSVSQALPHESPAARRCEIPSNPRLISEFLIQQKQAVADLPQALAINSRAFEERGL
jgi:hypothetical protein